MVVYFFVGNIGGGGFMVIWFNDGKIEILDYCEWVFVVVMINMYFDLFGELIVGISECGYFFVGILGMVVGFVEVYVWFGMLLWSDFV